MIQLMRPSPTPPQNIGVSFTQPRRDGKSIWILLPILLGCSFVKPINRSIFDESFRYPIHFGHCVRRLKGVAGEAIGAKARHLGSTVKHKYINLLSPVSPVGWNDLEPRNTTFSLKDVL